ncbi:MAG: hypothetical protein GH159_02260 [Dehalococcoidia bacterium]|nr:hypothetical protein [Dehalococcoidia bacterium]
MKEPECEIMIRLALPFQIRLKDGTYHCKLGENEFSIHLQSIKTDLVNGKVKSAEGDSKGSKVLTRPSTGELTEAVAAKVPGAMLQYSLVTLQFWKHGAIKSKEAQAETNEKNIALAHKFLNRFINVYRFITSDIEAHSLTRGELSEVRANQTLNFRINSPQQGKLIMGTYFGEHGFTSVPKTFGDDEHRRVTQMLLAGVEPPIVDLLLLNSRAFLRDGERRLTVVELGTAFDINVEQVTINILKLRDELSDEIRQRLENAFTIQIARSILQPIINEDLINSTPYTEWDTTFRPLRNRVVHDAYEPTSVEAEKALQVIESLHALLANVTPKS